MSNNIEQFPIANPELAKINGEARHMREIESGRCPSCGAAVEESVAMENQSFCSDSCLSNHVHAYGYPVLSFIGYKKLIEEANMDGKSFETLLRERSINESIVLSQEEVEVQYMEDLRDGVCPNRLQHEGSHIRVEDEYDSHGGFCGEDCFRSQVSAYPFLRSSKTYRELIKYAEYKKVSLVEVLDENNEEQMAA